MNDINKNSIAFRKTVRFKFTVVIVISTLILIGVLMGLSRNRHQHNAIIFSERTAERQESFQIISELESQPLKGLTNENTYWDDMVNFINKPNPKFEQEVFAAQLDSYHASAIWTYNTDFKLVSNTNNFVPPSSTYSLNLNKNSINQLFQSGYLQHFYRQSPYGLLEVYAATVHDSSDVEHKTTPKGYFFIARRLDDSYLKNLEQKTKDNVALVSSLTNLDSSGYSNAKKGQIVFYKPLNDESNRTVATEKISFSSSAIASLYNSLDSIVRLTSIIFIMLGVIIYFVLDGIIVRPMNKVRNALLQEDVSGLANLEKKDTEFGRIAALIKVAREQTDAISAAAEETKKAKQALETRSNELETINALMIDRELKMVELKKENEQLKKT